MGSEVCGGGRQSAYHDMMHITSNIQGALLERMILLIYHTIGSEWNSKEILAEDINISLHQFYGTFSLIFLTLSELWLIYFRFQSTVQYLIPFSHSIPKSEQFASD